MRAVNLIPTDATRAGGGPAASLHGPAYAVVGLLAVAVSFVTIYVLSNNTISERQAKLASLNVEVAQEQALAARLASYAKFAQLAQTRAQTVRQIAATRFDWHGALSDLSKVVPANTSLQSLTASVSPTATVEGGGITGSGAGAGLRSDITSPALELTGCTKTQDDVARLMSRLRLINGVTRITLGDSQKQDNAQAATAVSSSAGSPTGSSATHDCGPNTPTFDLVVFFAPLPGAAAAGAIPGSTEPVSGTTSASASTATTTTPSSTATATTPSSAGTVTTPPSTGTATTPPGAGTSTPTATTGGSR